MGGPKLPVQQCCTGEWATLWFLLWVSVTVLLSSLSFTWSFFLTFVIHLSISVETLYSIIVSVFVSLVRFVGAAWLMRLWRLQSVAWVRLTQGQHRDVFKLTRWFVKDSYSVVNHFILLYILQICSAGISCSLKKANLQAFFVNKE